MFCKYCGALIDDDSLVCPKCGKNLVSHPGEFAPYGVGVTSSGKSKIAAGILALLLGGIGVHNFYMGKIGAGIVDILFCWTGIHALVALIQGIIILCGSDEEFEARIKK